MKRDLGHEVARINTHCGFGLSEEEIEMLLPHFTIDSMKANLSKFNPTSVRWIDKGDGFTFIRKVHYPAMSVLLLLSAVS